MKTVCEFNKCTGCNLCVNVCAKNAIQIVDDIKACNAVIDETLCINCGQCEKLCPNNNPVEQKEPVLWKQGWANIEDIRSTSSSGGYAAAIEYAFIKNGGVVCSCKFDKGNFIFDFAYQADEVKKFVGSKYVKSNPENVYPTIKKLLGENKKVLFVGLPCQCAAAKKYTNEHELLYTIDLICHGTPSKKILDMFLSEKKYKIEKLNNLAFRKNTSFYLANEDNSIEVSPSVRDRYTMAFLKSLCYTENCYSCQYAKVSRISDLTLGDSWGSNLNDDEQKKGISLVLCQTDKGKELLNMSDIHMEDVDVENAIKNNRQLNSPSKKTKEYELFYKTFDRTGNFNKSVKKCYQKECFRQSIKSLLIKIKLLRG